MMFKTPIYVAVRRWYDGCNTYHSVAVTEADGTRRTEPFAYGYGEHFWHTVGVLLGLADPYQACDWRWRRETGIMPADVVDVRRRKDLHHAGRGKATIEAGNFDLR